MEQQRKTNRFAQLMAIAILIGVLYAIWKFVGFIIAGFKGLQPEIGVAVLAGCTTVLVSVLSIIFSKWFERRGEIAKEHQKKKAKIYEDFIGVWFEIMFADKLGKERLSEGEVVRKILPIIQQMVPWSSDEVIKAYVKFRDFSSQTGANQPTPLETMHIFEQMLISIRKDLGHSCRNLKQGDLIKLFIIDYGNYQQSR